MSTERVELLDDWSIELPRHFAREVGPDGAVVLWDDEATIRAMTVSTGGAADGSAVAARDMIGDTSSADVHEVLPGMVVAIWPQFAEEIDGEGIWTTPVGAAEPNKLLSLFFHAREASALDWVRDSHLTIRGS